MVEKWLFEKPLNFLAGAPLSTGSLNCMACQLASLKPIVKNVAFLKRMSATNRFESDR